MQKKMIFIAVIIGTIASLGVLGAMNKERPSQRNDVALDPADQHHAVPPQDFQKDSPAAIRRDGPAESQGIEGRVMDRQGNPVAGIEVIADNGGPSAGPLPKSWTDKEGHFLIKVRLAGTYEVYAVEKDYNTSPTSLFSSGGSLPPHVATVSVLEEQITSNIVLQKPPKSAKLMGRVLDADTNEAIVGSRITLRRADYPDYYLQTGPDEKGYFVISVPPAAVTVEVTSPGYEPWNYVRDDLPLVPMRVDSLKLNQGESRKLEVRLRRKAS